MNNKVLVAAVLLAGIAIGITASRWPLQSESTATTTTTPAEPVVLYWQAPMDPNYRRDVPGKSPMGMDMVPVYANAGSDDDDVVRISPTVVNNMGVRTAAVESGVLSRQVDTVGYVGYDEDTVHHIHTRVDGWIEQLSVKTVGDSVQAGQVLFELYSPTLVNAAEEFLAALRGKSDALKQASGDRLIALGVTKDEIERLRREGTVRQRVRTYAQNDGVVAELGVRLGMHVTPAMQVMSIANLDRVWILAEVFERQAAWIAPGQMAEVELDYLPGQVLSGKVDYVYPELDPKTRTLKVRMRFDNSDAVLRPNMFARVTIHGTETGDVVHVPREAVIRGGRTDRVVLALGEGRFRVQPVRVGIESGDRVEIRSGLAAGETVVISGQFLIDSESNIDSALERMDSGDNDESTADDAGQMSGMEHVQ